MTFLLIVTLRLLQVYSNILLVFALMSWFPRAYETKIGQIIIWLVRPIIKPFRNFRLTFAGMDFTIIGIIIVIDILSHFISNFI